MEMRIKGFTFGILFLQDSVYWSCRDPRRSGGGRRAGILLTDERDGGTEGVIVGAVPIWGGR
jgi:hypothetical protein